MNLPEDDQVHAVLMRLVVLVQAEFHHLAEALHGGNLGIKPLITFQLCVHVVSKHQAFHVLLT